MSENEDLYRELKAGQQVSSTRLVNRRAFRVSHHPARIGREFVVTKRGHEFVVTKRRDFVTPPPKLDEDYSVFKAAMTTFAEDIKLEIRDQHQQTRAEVQTVRHDVLAAVKASPAEYVKLVCEFVSLFLLFSLAVRFALKIELVNPAFAVFMLLACALYWCMASLKQRSEKRSKHPQA